MSSHEKKTRTLEVSVDGLQKWYHASRLQNGCLLVCPQTHTFVGEALSGYLENVANSPFKSGSRDRPLRSTLGELARM